LVKKIIVKQELLVPKAALGISRISGQAEKK
jgi:hypothetical protein